MGLSKKDEELIQDLFSKAVSIGKTAAKDKYKLTERRLYAYPVLKRNLERYGKDIEDIKHEDLRKSQDFVLYIKNSGSKIKPDIEDLRRERIALIENKRARDEKEIAEIDAAIQEISGEEYYPAIELHYFKRVREDEIAEVMHCDKTTVYRNRKRLINMLNVSLYGADALQ